MKPEYNNSITNPVKHWQEPLYYLKSTDCWLKYIYTTNRIYSQCGDAAFTLDTSPTAAFCCLYWAVKLETTKQRQLNIIREDLAEQEMW